MAAPAPRLFFEAPADDDAGHPGGGLLFWPAFCPLPLPRPPTRPYTNRAALSLFLFPSHAQAPTSGLGHASTGLFRSPSMLLPRRTQSLLKGPFVVAMLLGTVLGLIARPAHAFWTPAQPFGHRQARPQPQLLQATQGGGTSGGGGGSGWRGGPRPDEEAVDLSGDGGVTKRVIRPGFGYKQESPPPHAYCKVAFVMKTATGQVIADRMKQPMEFMLVRCVSTLWIRIDK